MTSEDFIHRIKTHDQLFTIFACQEYRNLTKTFSWHTANRLNRFAADDLDRNFQPTAESNSFTSCVTAIGKINGSKKNSSTRGVETEACSSNMLLYRCDVLLFLVAAAKKNHNIKCTHIHDGRQLVYTRCISAQVTDFPAGSVKVDT